MGFATSPVSNTYWHLTTHDMYSHEFSFLGQEQRTMLLTEDKILRDLLLSSATDIRKIRQHPIKAKPKSFGIHG